MLTLDTVRAALSAAAPAEAVDRLVRQELAAGLRTAEIYNALVPIARTIRAADRLADDADEVLLGTLDALIGHCNPDECYRDPPAAVRVPVSDASPNPAGLPTA